MDYSPIVAQFWGLLTWCIPAALQIGLFTSPRAKEEPVTCWVPLLANWQMEKQIYHRLHNVTSSTPDGITQIYGIFVLETKSMIAGSLAATKDALDAKALEEYLQSTEPPATKLHAPQSAGTATLHPIPVIMAKFR